MGQISANHPSHHDIQASLLTQERDHGFAVTPERPLCRLSSGSAYYESILSFP